MDELENPIEQIQEDIQHHATHSAHEGNEARAKLINMSALFSALLAVLAAISALMSGRYANEAMIEQIKSSDHWAHYQAKSIKASIAELKEKLGHDTKAADDYRVEQDKIREEAGAAESASALDLRKHESWAAAVTFFQIAIALMAITILTRKRRFFGVAAGLGLFGIGWIIRSLLL